MREEVARLLHQHRVAGLGQRPDHERQPAGVAGRGEERRRVVRALQLRGEEGRERGEVVAASCGRAVLQDVPRVVSGREACRAILHRIHRQQAERGLPDGEVEDRGRLLGDLPRRQSERGDRTSQPRGHYRAANVEREVARPRRTARDGSACELRAPWWLGAARGHFQRTTWEDLREGDTLLSYSIVK